MRLPPSLRNIYKELAADLGVPVATSGDLTRWADQGVLLLNAVLTVRAGEAGSHAGKGWEDFTDAAIRALNDKSDRVVFVLWGAYARKKARLVTGAHHTVIESAHPSPLSAKKFFGTRPFSAVNKALVDAGLPEIAWGPQTTGNWNPAAPVRRGRGDRSRPGGRATPALPPAARGGGACRRGREGESGAGGAAGA